MTPGQILDQLAAQGYVVLEDYLSVDQLEAMQLESEVLYEIAQENAAVTDGHPLRWGRDSSSSCIYEGVPGHLCTPLVKTCYQAYRQARTQPPLGEAVWRLIFQSQITDLMLSLLGPQAVLFNDQYILKPPHTPLSSFQWHRDSDWCRSEQYTLLPYLSLWTALDDMTPANGCLVVQPGSHRGEFWRERASGTAGGCEAGGAGEREGCSSGCEQGAEGGGEEGEGGGREGGCGCQGVMGGLVQGGGRGVEIVRSGSRGGGCLNGMARKGLVWGGTASLGEAGTLPHAALPLSVRAGTVILTTDTLLHCSGPNASRHTRRAWMPQFSAGPITRACDGQAVGLAVKLGP